MKPFLGMMTMVCLLCAANCSLAATAVLTKSGVAIDAGSIGKFVLPYPSLAAGGTPASADISGDTAELYYLNGVKIHTVLKPGGDLSFDLSDLPADCKNFRVDLNIPESLKGAVNWSIDGSDAKLLPLEKVDGAFLSRGNSKKFAISGVKEPKDGLTISIPSGWMQLQDNRFWNGHEFAWFTAMDIPASDGKANIVFHLSDGAGEPITVNNAPINLLKVKLSEKGIIVSNGSAGELVLSFPSLINAGALLRCTEAKLADDGKSIDLKFPSGTAGVLRLIRKDITVEFQNLPKDTSAFRMDMEIPMACADGGTYGIGGTLVTPFPKDKPASPYLFQGNADSLSLMYARGPDLRIMLPAFSYQQLQDNREWDWPIFAWWMSTSISDDTPGTHYTIKFDGGNSN